MSSPGEEVTASRRTQISHNIDHALSTEGPSTHILNQIERNSQLSISQSHLHCSNLDHYTMATDPSNFAALSGPQFDSHRFIGADFCSDWNSYGTDATVQPSTQSLLASFETNFDDRSVTGLNGYSHLSDQGPGQKVRHSESPSLQPRRDIQQEDLALPPEGAHLDRLYQNNSHNDPNVVDIEEEVDNSVPSLNQALNEVNHLIAQSSDMTKVKELKQRRRVLRNRRSA